MQKKNWLHGEKWTVQLNNLYKYNRAILSPKLTIDAIYNRMQKDLLYTQVFITTFTIRRIPKPWDCINQCLLMLLHYKLQIAIEFATDKQWGKGSKLQNAP